MRPKIYLFGDSITEHSFGDGGWGASLAHHFARNADVAIRGYSGYNTRWALMAIDKVFPPPPPATAENGINGGGGGGYEAAPVCVTVFFGANDASLPNRHAAFQHVPIDEYKQNLHSIVSFFKKRWPSTHVILITPPPIDEATRILNAYVKNKSGLPERTNESAGNYAKACVTVASNCGIPVIDLWTKMQQSPDWRTDYLWYESLFSFSKLLAFASIIEL
ncbi:OLC1v1021373C1 [Oldenlandia corymbosa var. corymbosa]|uniref:OLC1v1021373C1 n=1 Tax=Oldenlandia corymbosa var. corymbosa TaxID=529605 RepID=A0AAV1BVH9_OLDCO|nr:OLC1v1021373C1 [Oldenlandia corymbosa var. corymbosa]